MNFCQRNADLREIHVQRSMNINIIFIFFQLKCDFLSIITSRLPNKIKDQDTSFG